MINQSSQFCSNIAHEQNLVKVNQSISVSDGKSIKHSVRRNYEHMHFLGDFHAEELRARSISSNDRPFVSTTLPAMYKTARTQTAEKPK